MASTLAAGEVFTLESLALTLTDALALAIGGVNVRTAPQRIVLMPADVPHAVHAAEPSRMLLIMLREAPRQRNAPG